MKNSEEKSFNKKEAFPIDSEIRTEEDRAELKETANKILELLRENFGEEINFVMTIFDSEDERNYFTFQDDNEGGTGSTFSGYNYDSAEKALVESRKRFKESKGEDAKEILEARNKLNQTKE